ncbi:hypothetical protein J6590_027325 [Homalodisca vitripennis]|nr:hypothetical protein J6590_027325 [Homalodisca vitripennis]
MTYHDCGGGTIRPIRRGAGKMAGLPYTARHKNNHSGLSAIRSCFMQLYCPLRFSITLPHRVCDTPKGQGRLPLILRSSTKDLIGPDGGQR